MLRKQYLVTVIPAVEAVEGQPASLVCTPPPPPADPGGPPPPPPPPPPPEYPTAGSTIYLYVPNNPTDESAGQVRTESVAPEPAGYTCFTGIYYVPDPADPKLLQPVYETRCDWNYPP